MTRRALLLGYGSIGQKRAHILRDFGWDLTIWEPDLERRLVARADGFDDVEPGGHAARALPPTATVAFVCSPPACHEEHAIVCLEHGCHVFIEKPIAHTMSAAVAIADAAADHDRHVMVGCNYRFADLLGVAQDTIHALDITMHYHLPTARPEWQDSYVNDPDQGGVCLDSGAHAIDLARYLAGPITRLAEARRGHSLHPQRLGMATEESAGFTLFHENRIWTHLRLDWSLTKASRIVTFELKSGVRIQAELWDGTDQMYEQEMRTFLRAVTSKRPSRAAPPNGPTEAIDTLRWCLTARNQIRASLLLPAVPA